MSRTYVTLMAAAKNDAMKAPMTIPDAKKKAFHSILKLKGLCNMQALLDNLFDEDVT